MKRLESLVLMLTLGWLASGCSLTKHHVGEVDPSASRKDRECRVCIVVDDNAGQGNEALQRFLYAGLQFGETEDEIRHVFGNPSSRKVENVVNIHDGKQDQYVTLTYPGVMFSFYHVANESRDILNIVTISSQAIPTESVLNVGSLRKSVVDLLGPPDCISTLSPYSEELWYETNDIEGGYIKYIVFQVNKGIVMQIKWIFPYD